MALDDDQILYFFEKPGCSNNAKQKELLEKSGYQLEVINLLEVKWTWKRLRKYFQNVPVSEYFNISAPDIKSGKIIPEQFSEKQAFELMIEKPILIKRPLMHKGNSFMAGFDLKKVNSWLALDIDDDSVDLETCLKM